jgi:hypothetical protein
MASYSYLNLKFIRIETKIETNEKRNKKNTYFLIIN